MKDDDKYFKYMEEDGTVYKKESIFSCIRPIDGTTPLIVYASSNITGLEGIVHRAYKVVCICSFSFIACSSSINFNLFKL